MIIRSLIFSLVLGLMAACAGKGVVTSKEFCVKLGQEWTYQTRDKEKDSRVVIVEAFRDDKRQRFFIVRVTNVQIDSPNYKNYFSGNEAYFVLSEPALEASLVALVGESVWNPFFDRHYQSWRKDLKGPDYLGFTVKDKLNTLEDILSTKIGA